MIPAVVELFGLVIVSFLNAVIHRVALRMRDVKIGGMLGTFLGTVSGAQGLSRGVRRGAFVGGPDGYGNVPAPEHPALQSVPGRARRLAAVLGTGALGLLHAAKRGDVDGAPEAEGRAVEGAQDKGARFLQNAGGWARHRPRGDKGRASLAKPPELRPAARRVPQASGGRRVRR
jgi:hypothetical protein